MHLIFFCCWVLEPRKRGRRRVARHKHHLDVSLGGQVGCSCLPMFTMGLVHPTYVYHKHHNQMSANAFIIQYWVRVLKLT